MPKFFKNHISGACLFFWVYMLQKLDTSVMFVFYCQEPVTCFGIGAVLPQQICIPVSSHLPGNLTDARLEAGSGHFYSIGSKKDTLPYILKNPTHGFPEFQSEIEVQAHC